MEVVMFSSLYGSFELILREGKVYSLRKIENIKYETNNALLERIKNYLKGEMEDFSDVPIDWEGYNRDEIKVFKNVRKISYGERKSYLWVAKESGFPKKWRWIGYVLSKNRVPIIIPCHRVIKSNGKIGKFIWGKEWKRKLLELENKTKSER